MNSDHPHMPSDDPESRITALLLGELDEAAAAALRREIAANPGLAALQERLVRTLELVRASVNPGAVAGGSPSSTPARLSEGRRNRLLEQLGRTPAAPAPRRWREQILWAGPMAAAAVLLALLGLGAMMFWRDDSLSWIGRDERRSYMVAIGESPALAKAEGLRLPPPPLDPAETPPPEPFFEKRPALTAEGKGVALGDEIRDAKREMFSDAPPPPAAPAGAGGAEGRKEKLYFAFGGLAGTPVQNMDADSIAVTPAPPASLAADKLGRDVAGLGDFGAGVAPARSTPLSEGDGNAAMANRWGFANHVNGNLPQVDGTIHVTQGVTGPAEAGDVALRGVSTADAEQERELRRQLSLSQDPGVNSHPLAPPAPVPPVEKELLLKRRVMDEVKLREAPESGTATRSRFAGRADAPKPVAEVAGKPVALGLDLSAADTPAGGRAKGGTTAESDVGRPVTAPRGSVAVPQPEVTTLANAFSTFSLNVSDVSFRLAAASLEKGQVPDPGGIRTEEFINAFDYRDPAPAPGVPVGFAWERATWPFAQQRDLLRFAVRTAAHGRENARPLHVVVLLDNSGSMERADRVQIVREALRVLGRQLQPQDRLSVVTFARTARLWLDAIPGDQAPARLEALGTLNPEGGTNLEEALNLAYETASRHFLAPGVNRVVLLTDGAANLGDTDAASLRRKVESWRQRGVALDCFGIGWEGYNDDLLEQLSRNGDGRYGFVNTPEEAATGFAAQLAGALQVAAADVKVQVEFNPRRVTAWRQVGYARHQLTQQQFRDNTVDAAELGAAESGNALYVVQTDPQGAGPVATVRVRFRDPGTGAYREHEWVVPFQGSATELDHASPGLRLAGVAAAFAEMLSASPFAGEVTLDRLAPLLQGVPAAFQPDPRPARLEAMLQQARAALGSR